MARSPGGLPAEFLGAQAAAYARLVGLLGLQRLDATRGSESLGDEVVYQVLSSYFGDYHTLLNSVFGKNPGQWK